MKRIILLAAFMLAFSPLTQAATRCVNLIDGHVTQNTLDLSNCDLHPDDLSPIETYLEAHPTITTLDISGNYRLFTEKNATAFLTNTTLKEINANNTMSYANSDYIVRLLITIPTLKKLSIENDKLSDQALIWLSTSGRGLQSLDLVDNKGITENGLFAFIRTANLKTLNIDHLPLSNRLLFALAMMPNLTDVEFGDHQMTKIDDGLLNVLVYKKTLTNFGMHGMNISTAQLETIAKNKHITHLSITKSNIDYRNCAVIAKNAALTYLDISGSYLLDGDCLKQFSTLQLLDTLIIDDFNHIDGNDFEYLKKNKNLHTLVIDANGMKNINSTADIPSLNSLTLRHAPVNDEFFKKLAANTQLSALIIDDSYAHDVPTEGLKALSETTHIKKLTLTASEYINSDIAALFAKNANYQVLDLSRHRLKEDDLALFKNSTLTKLVLYDNAFNPNGDAARHFLAESHIPTVEFVKPYYRAIEK